MCMEPQLHGLSGLDHLKISSQSSLHKKQPSQTEGLANSIQTNHWLPCSNFLLFFQPSSCVFIILCFKPSSAERNIHLNICQSRCQWPSSNPHVKQEVHTSRHSINTPLSTKRTGTRPKASLSMPYWTQPNETLYFYLGTARQNKVQ